MARVAYNPKVHIHPNHTVAFDGTPVFRGLAHALYFARHHGWSGKLVSADRRKGVAEKYGKMSQVALYLGFLAHKLGFNPANPPGRSTHELRSDGEAYRGPIGRPLSFWQLGLDVEEAGELVSVLRQHGFGVRQPYSSASEAHHVNFTRNPMPRIRRLWRKGISKKVTGVSQAGVHLVASFEGFRSKPYKDSVGVWTIGYGETKGVGPNTHPLTEGHARMLLEKRLKDDYFPYVRALPTFQKLNQNQVDALTSFIYNVGPGGISHNTKVGRALREGSFHNAADLLLEWNKGGGRVIPGLTRRRQEERALFLRK